MSPESLEIRAKFLDWLKYKSGFYKEVVRQGANEPSQTFLRLTLEELDRDITFWENLNNVYEHKDQHHLFVRGLPDEPSFLLLGRDRSAPDMVRQWAYEREREIATGNKPTTDNNQVANARQIAQEMEKWRRENEGVWRK